MINPLYLQLYEPRKIKVTDHNESATVDAPVMKILRYSGIDENYPIPHIVVVFAYGFIDSENNFVQYERVTHTEIICDVVAAKNEVVGTDRLVINPITKIAENEGRWFSELTKPTTEQPNRMRGDFRITDLYLHLMVKYDIKGDLINADSKTTMARNLNNRSS